MIRYHARWVLPISAAPIERGTVVEDGGRIVYVGRRTGAPRGEDRDLGDVALLPGLVNAHTHLELTAMRGTLEDLAFHEWIAQMRVRRDWLFSGEVALDSARWGIVEGLRCGITTVADTSPTGMAAHAIVEAGARGVVYQEVFGPDPERCDAMMQELEERVAALRRLESPLLRIGVSPHAPYTVSDRLYADAAAFAHRSGLPVAAHVAESAAETELVVQARGVFGDALRERNIAVAPRATSPIDLLRRVGVLGPRTLLIHCVQLAGDDVQTIARSGSSVAHCPVSNAKLGHGIAPLLDLLEAGVAVGLGSDSVASNNRMDVLDEARAAILLQRASDRRHDALSANAALALATLGGARALGLDSRVGSLDVGKDADLAAFAVDDPTPLGDPASALVFSLYRRRAEFVAVAGRPLVENGQVLGDWTALQQRVAVAADALGAYAPAPSRAGKIVTTPA